MKVISPERDHRRTIRANNIEYPMGPKLKMDGKGRIAYSVRLRHTYPVG